MSEIIVSTNIPSIELSVNTPSAINMELMSLPPIEMELGIGARGEPGEDGYTPIKGVDYFDGADGYTPVKGVDYFDGADGYTPVKGVDYFDGADGTNGVDGDDGYTPIKGVDYFDGADGYTPIKGVDYFDGEDGLGVPAGGTTNQLLAKKSNADNDTEWKDPPSAGVWGSITGTLSSQTDLNTALSGKEPTIASKLTAFNKNYGTTSTDVKMNGTQGVGSVDDIARIDHVHPTDTSRGTSNLAVADLTGTAETLGGSAVVGSASTASRSDHRHAITNPALDTLASPTDITTLNASTSAHGLVVKATAPASTFINVVGIGNGETAYTNKALFDATTPAMDGTASAGISTSVARRDHVHPTDTSREASIGTKNTAFNVNFETATANIKMDGAVNVGALSTVARADHIHASDTSREPVISSKLTAFNKNYGTTSTDVKMNGTQGVGSVDDIARIDHVHPTDTGRQPLGNELTALQALADTAGFVKKTGDGAYSVDTATYNNYSHPTGDGNLHVPATGTTNSGKVLTAGATAGAITWEEASGGSVTSATMTGTGAFSASATTDTVTDGFITANTFVVISPTGTQAGSWSVEATTGSFTVTSDTAEADTATYDWVGIVDGVTSGAFSAFAIANTPAGSISANNVQTALNELDTEKAPLADPEFTGSIILSSIAVPSAPIANNLTLFARNKAGRTLLNTIVNSGLDTPLQPALFGNSVYMWLPGATTTVSIAFGSTWIARNASGAQSTPVKAATNFLTQMNRALFSCTAVANTSSGIQSTNSVGVRGNATGIGGFFYFARFGVETYSGTGQQIMVGLSSTSGALAGEPSSAMADMLGITKDSGETTWKFTSRTSTGAATKVDTGVTISAGVVFDLTMFCKSNDNKVTVRLVRQNDGVVIMDNVEVTLTLPTNTTFLFAHAQLRNTGTAINALALNRIYVETDI